MVVDTSNAERDDLNRMAQLRRLERRRAGRRRHAPQRPAASSGAAIACSSRAIYRPIPESGRRRLRQVKNGTSALVVDVDAGRQRATLELHERAGVRRWRLVPDVPIELGYARHVAKAQGVTHEDTDLAISRQTHRNELYVMASARATAPVPCRCRRPGRERPAGRGPSPTSAR